MSNPYENPEFSDDNSLNSTSSSNASSIKNKIFSENPPSEYMQREENAGNDVGSAFGNGVEPSSTMTGQEAQALDGEYIGTMLSVGEIDDEEVPDTDDENLEEFANDIPESEDNATSPPIKRGFNKSNLILGGLLAAGLAVGGWLVFGGSSNPRASSNGDTASDVSAASDVESQNNSLPPLPDYSASSTTPALSASEVDSINQMVRDSVYGASAPNQTNAAPAASPLSASQVEAVPASSVANPNVAVEPQPGYTSSAAIAPTPAASAPVNYNAMTQAASDVTASPKQEVPPKQEIQITDNQWAIFFNGNQVLTKEDQVRLLKQRISTLTGESYSGGVCMPTDEVVAHANNTAKRSHAHVAKKKTVKRTTSTPKANKGSASKAVNFTVQAVIFGQMWVKTSDGNYRSYVNGDISPNGGVIKDINPNTRIMTTTNGQYRLPR